MAHNISSAAAAVTAALQSSIISMDVNQELIDAIKAISDAADKEGLLKNPFIDVEEIVFIDPLTIAEVRTLENAQNTVEEAQKEILALITSDSNAVPFIIERIDRLNEQINDLQFDIIDPLLAKRANAQVEFNDAEAKNRLLLGEFERLKDQFEIFKTEGLGGLLKRVQPEFERNAKNYINDEPEILFMAEYKLEDQFIGTLLCFKKYRNSTHYEIFKKNLFQFDSDFERILYIHKQDLKEETNHYISYVRDILGFTDIIFDEVFIVLDTHFKSDRIYEYSIAAAKIPEKPSDVDYDLILESRGLLNRSTLSNFSNATLFTWSGVLLGATDLAWVLSVVNEGVTFFGRAASEQSLQSIIVDPEIVPGGSVIFVPKNINDVLCIIQDSISLLRSAPTMGHLVQVLGGLPSEFLAPLDAAIDQERDLFVYDKFREKLKESAPVFQLILEIAETQDPDALSQLSQLSVVLPTNTGSESITTILGLSNVFKFMNDMFITLTYSQDDESFEKLVEIRALIELNREREEPLEEAVKNERDVVAAQTLLVDDFVATLYSVNLGEKQSVESTASETAESTSTTSTSKSTTLTSTSSTKGFSLI